MSVVAAGDHGAAYACPCLNVCIQARQADTPPPESVDDPDYSQVYVGESIEIKHPEFTLRNRKRVAAIPGTNRYSRFIGVKCLLCNTPVYRILQVVPADVEGKDGPVLPADDYVEKEVLKAPTGWIEVGKDLLTGDAIAQAESSASYSSLFTVIVPPLPPSETPTPNGLHRVPSQDTSRSRSPSPEPPSVFSHLKSILLPPPFTPSHPAFLHLAQLAQKESQERRTAAENYVAEIIRQKTAEIEREDAATRQQVEALWRKFRVSIKEAHATAPPTSRSTGRRTSRSRERRGARSVSPAYGTPIAVRDFVPVSVPARRTASAAPARQSALSASLVTTSFHHPRAPADSESSQEPGSPDSDSSKTLSTDSSTLVQQPHSVGDGISILQFRRNTNETINTQATYRVFLLEEQVTNSRKEREAAARKTQEAQTETRATTSKAAGVATTSAAESVAKPNSSEVNDGPSRGRQGKGKRKVTFDVEPDAIPLRQDGQEVGQTEESGNPVDMIFPMEDLEGDAGKSPEEAASLPLLEQPTTTRPARLGRPRPQIMPEELASLRPSSLPAPSYIRPIRSSPGVDSSSTRGMMVSLPQHSNPLARRPPRTNGTKAPLSPTTDSPNQRGAWSADGRTWLPFNRGHNTTPTSIPEETETETETDAVTNETVQEADAPNISKPFPLRAIPVGANIVYETDDDDYSIEQAGIPRSLPIQIHSRIVRQPLSLASFRPPSAIPEHEQEAEAEPAVNGGKPKASSAIRKAVYAERDRSRSMDPGAMDFDNEEEDDDDDEDGEAEESSEDVQAQPQSEVTSRGRKQAFKILEAVNKVPDSGMWRSLAN